MAKFDKVKVCKHEWKTLTHDWRSGPGVGVCEKCGISLSHASRLQLDMNQHVTGFQKWISITTILISIIALVISIIALLKS